MNYLTSFPVACVDFLVLNGVLQPSCSLENFFILRYSSVHMLSIPRVYFAVYARIIGYTQVYLQYMRVYLRYTRVYYKYSELFSTLLLILFMLYKTVSWRLRSSRLPRLPQGLPLLLQKNTTISQKSILPILKFEPGLPAC